jgi:GTP cyclohydrolase I
MQTLPQKSKERHTCRRTKMSSLSKEAILVHEALVARGLETPLRPPVQEIDNETRKRLIAGHMTEIMQLLNLDLSDDSLMETPHRIAKMYVDEIFSGWITPTSRKSPSSKTR